MNLEFDASSTENHESADFNLIVRQLAASPPKTTATPTRPCEFKVRMDTYRYTPLESPRHIRLLHLKIDSVESPVVCTMTQVSLDEKPIFEALSYTWEIDDKLSDIEDHRMIMCDGLELSVAPNLFAALKHLRLASNITQRDLWVDAVCINQRDNSERSQQVQIMHLIYSQAEYVVAWLGEERASDSGSTRALKNICEYIESKEEDFKWTDAVRDVWQPEEGGLPAANSQDWTAIGSLFGKRWFTRVWVIQEIVMAHLMEFRCGYSKIGWAYIEEATGFLNASGLAGLPSTSKGSPGFYMICLASQLKKNLEEGKSWGIMDILSITRAFGATNPRDRLYAFLGMIADKTDQIFIPDYDTPDELLFTQWAAYSLINQRSYACLSLAQPSLSSRGLPSWAPDWGGLSKFPQPFLDVSSFNAFTSSLRSVSLSKDQTTLTLLGLQLDEILAVGTERSKRYLDENESGVTQLQHLLSSAKTFIAESEKMLVETFASDGYPFEAFWRTLICNTTRDNATCPPEYAESFKAYKDCLDKVGREGTLHSDNDHEWLKKRMLDGIPYEQAFAWGTGRIFGVSREHRMGMFPRTTRQGDIICAFTGARTPFVIREQGNDIYQFVGECYVDGMMNGEISQLPGFQDRLENISLR